MPDVLTSLLSTLNIAPTLGTSALAASADVISNGGQAIATPSFGQTLDQFLETRDASVERSLVGSAADPRQQPAADGKELPAADSNDTPLDAVETPAWLAALVMPPIVMPLIAPPPPPATSTAPGGATNAAPSLGAASILASASRPLSSAPQPVPLSTEPTAADALVPDATFQTSPPAPTTNASPHRLSAQAPTQPVAADLLYPASADDAVTPPAPASGATAPVADRAVLAALQPATVRLDLSRAATMPVIPASGSQAIADVDTTGLNNLSVTPLLVAVARTSSTSASMATPAPTRGGGTATRLPGVRLSDPASLTQPPATSQRAALGVTTPPSGTPPVSPAQTSTPTPEPLRGQPAVAAEQPVLAAADVRPAATITVSATPQPAGQLFAAAIATAASWRNGSDRTTPRDPAGDAATTIITAPIALQEHAVVHAAADAQGSALDLTKDSGLQRMIDRIETLRDDKDAGDTRIRLVPDALGSVDIAVRQEGDRVHVRFTAEQDATRALIADAQPRLTELAAARGVRMGETSVGGGSSGGDVANGNNAPPQPRPTPPLARAPLGVADDTPTPDGQRLA